MSRWLVGSSSSRKLAGRQQHPGQRVAIAFAAGEHADRLENIVVGEQETAQQAAQLVLLAARRDAADVVEHAGVGVEHLVLVLREVVRRDVVAERELARGDGLAPASMRISVDLPAPLTPTSAMRSPRSMVKFTSSKHVLVAVALRDVLELPRQCGRWLAAAGK